MSLLMDALRKAEKAKQAEEEAQQRKAPEATPLEDPLSLSPVEESAEEVHRKSQSPEERPGDLTLEGISEQASAPGDAASSLALEDIDEFAELPKEQPQDNPPQTNIADAPVHSPTSEEASSSGYEATEALTADGNTSPTGELPSPKGRKPPLSFEGDDYLSTDYLSKLRSDDTAPAKDEDPISADEAPTLRGADTSTTIRSVAHLGDDTRKSARAVFDAKAPARRNLQKWAVMVGAPLLVLILAGGGYYFWSELTGGPGVVPRSTAALRPLPPRVPTVPQPREPGRSFTDGTAAAPGSQIPNQSGRPDTPAVQPSMQEPPSMQEAIELAASAPAKRSRSGGSVSVGSTGALEDWARTSTTESGLPRAGPGVQTARGAGTTDSSGPAIEEDRGFQIARRQVPEKTSPVLERAFDAFNNGALAVADAAYISVLEQEPNNRDALLGLAAVSVRKGKRDAAANIYLKLLSLNPKDSVAQAGLIGLQRGLDPVVAESRIKLLMDKEPNAGHLHFSLGNLYATQARWGEAQGAYFSAYRVDSENPDYAYNLAVSLDHLAQRDAALSYYRRALALANGQPVGFRATAVRNRIRAITGSTTTP